jgi:hypothetical protein
MQLEEIYMEKIPIEIVPKSEAHQQLIDLYPPQLANKFLPEWYKKQKIYSREHIPQMKDVKNCPAIQEVMTSGIIIPAWSDILIEKINKENKWEWQVTVGMSYAYDESAEWMLDQPITQFTGMKDNNFKVNLIKKLGALKLVSPYWFRTPPGWGIEFTDPFYHHRRNIKLFPGRVESDKWHETNFPFEFYDNLDDEEQGEIIVRAGEPLVMLTPYKIDLSAELVVKKHSENFTKLQVRNSQILSSVTSDWIRYKQKHNEFYSQKEKKQS